MIIIFQPSIFRCNFFLLVFKEGKPTKSSVILTPQEGLELESPVLKEDVRLHLGCHCLEDHPRTCKWLISLVSKSPNWGCLLPLPNGRTPWLINGGDPNHVSMSRDDPPSGILGAICPKYWLKSSGCNS